MEKSLASEEMWDAYLAASGRTGDYNVAAFGDHPALVDELLALVLDGTKRATAAAVREFEHVGEPLPRPGDHFIVLDSHDVPHCVCRTTEVRVGPLSSVRPAFAWDEGEGDRTREDWLHEHHRYFDRVARSEGIDFAEDVEVVFERFSVVWPPEHADPPGGPRSEIDPFNLTETYLHLRLGAGVAAMPGGPEFWSKLASRPHLRSGRLVTAFKVDHDWEHWERHPLGGRFVYLLDGAIDLILDPPGGQQIIQLRGREGIVVPPGVWHRAVVHEPGEILTITPGAETEHRAVG